MSIKRPALTSSLLPVQLALTAVVLAILLFAPPVRGTIMLVPIGATARHAMLPLAIAHGARLVAPGRLPGSFIVYGEQARLAPVLIPNGIILLDAPATGCGDLSKGVRNVFV